MYIKIDKQQITVCDTNAYAPTDEACDLIEHVAKKLNVTLGDWGGNNDKRELYAEFTHSLSDEDYVKSQAVEVTLNMALALGILDFNKLKS